MQIGATLMNETARQTLAVLVDIKNRIKIAVKKRKKGKKSE